MCRSQSSGQRVRGQKGALLTANESRLSLNPADSRGAVDGLCASGTVTTTVTPLTLKPLAEIPTSTPSDIARAVVKARQAQPVWARQATARHSAVCARLRRQLSQELDRIGRLIRQESGVPRETALDELEHLGRVLRRRSHLRHLRTGLGRPWRAPDTGQTGTRVTTAGRADVVAMVTPWTYPIPYAAVDAMTALAAGSAIVQQVDVQNALTALLMRDLAEQAGLPPGLWQIVAAPTADGLAPEICAALAEHADRLHYTGPPAQARAVGRQAATLLTTSVINVGSHNAVVVVNDADLDAAAASTARACLVRAGQTCLTPRHIYVTQRVGPAFARKLAARMTSLDDHGEGIGSLTFAAQASALDEHVARAVRAGATLLCGGRTRPEAGPRRYAPTLLAVSPGLVDEPPIGPVINLTIVSDADEAIRHIRSAGPTLHSAVFSRNRSRGRDLAKRLTARAVTVNPTTAPVPCWHLS